MPSSVIQKPRLNAKVAVGNWFAERNWKPAPENKAKRKSAAAPLTVLWITPMRALAADTQRALQVPLDALLATGGFAPWTIGARSGDTSSAERSAQHGV